LFPNTVTAYIYISGKLTFLIVFHVVTLKYAGQKSIFNVTE